MPAEHFERNRIEELLHAVLERPAASRQASSIRGEVTSLLAVLQDHEELSGATPAREESAPEFWEPLRPQHSC
jgi:hypothetical protein